MAMARILLLVIVFAVNNLEMGRILSLAVARGVVRALGIQAGIPHFVIAALIFSSVRIGKGARSAVLPPSPIVPLPDALPLQLELQQRRHSPIGRVTLLPRRRRVAASPAPVAPLVYAIVVDVGVTEHHGVLQQREGRAETIGHARARLLVSGPRRPPRFPFDELSLSSTSSFEGSMCIGEVCRVRESRQHRFQYSALAINVAHDARKVLPTLCPGPYLDVTNTRTTPFAIRSAVALSKYSGYRDIAGRASRTATVVDRGAVAVDRDAVVVAVVASIWLGWRYATMLSPAAVIASSLRMRRYVATA